jgi:hypothetical protein
MIVFKINAFNVISQGKEWHRINKRITGPCLISQQEQAFCYTNHNTIHIAPSFIMTTGSLADMYKQDHNMNHCHENLKSQTNI